MLTSKSVATAALAAHAEGKLIYQNPGLTTAYENNGCYCAIGAALTPEEHQRVSDANSDYTDIVTLAEASILEVEPNDLDTLLRIQLRHDSLASINEPDDTNFVAMLQELAQ